MDRVDKDIAELKADIATLRADVAYLKNSALECRLDRKVRTTTRQALALRRPHLMHGPVQEPDREFIKRIDEALEDGRITAEQDARIEATDFILRAQRRHNRQPVWVAVEVSNKVHAHNVERVRATADALRIVFGEEAIAVVIGYRMDPPDAKRAQASGVRYLPVSLPTPA